MISGFLPSQLSLKLFPLVCLLCSLISFIPPISFHFLNPIPLYLFSFSFSFSLLLFPLIFSSFSHPEKRILLYMSTYLFSLLLTFLFPSLASFVSSTLLSLFPPLFPHPLL